MKELGDYLFEYFMDELEQGNKSRIKDAFELYNVYKNMCERTMKDYGKFKYNLAKEFYEKEVRK